MPNMYPGVLHIGDTFLPVNSRLARWGMVGVRQQYNTETGDVSAIIHVHPGLRGWYARRWLGKNPLKYTVTMKRVGWDDWREVDCPVTVEARR